MTQNPTLKTFTAADFYQFNFQATWLGYRIQKNPLDLIQYQQQIYDIRPDFLFECGSFHGGSALYFATIMDAINHGVVVSIDPNVWPSRPIHNRIQFVQESSINEEMVEAFKAYARLAPRVMVVLDSDHTKKHVLKELELYAPMVTLGSYCVVEDTNIHGHPLRLDLPEGPWEAVHEWLPDHPEFEIDHNVEPAISNNPDGWLRRIK